MTAATPTLTSPLVLPAAEGDGLTLRNRMLIAPMCQYSAVNSDGLPQLWHLQHYGAMAAGGFGLVLVEATSVQPAGRITPRDLGLWEDTQISGHANIVSIIRTSGAVAGVQLAHAGAKASTYPPLPGFARGSASLDDGGWQTVGPVSGSLQPSLAPARALTSEEIVRCIEDFAAATKRSDAAGYDVVQIHAAHGYLLHQFLSPLSNTRTDEWGGSWEGRTRLVREVSRAVREAWPAHKPLGIRFSAVDWVEGGWTVDDTARLARELVAEGLVTWVDVSSGGLTADAPIPVGPSYQVPLAARIRRELEGTEAIVSAVGLIDSGEQAEQILRDGNADAISIGRAALRNPHWAAHAAHELGVASEDNPQAPQYHRSGW